MGIKKIGSSAFSGCSKLNAPNITQDATFIGDYAFDKCYALSSLILNNSLKEIGNYAFRSCSALQSAILPEALKKLGQSVFYGCSSLKTASLPQSIVDIPAQTFYNCYNLESLDFSDGVETFGNQAFYGCSKLPKTIEDGMTFFGSSSNPYMQLLSVSDKSKSSYNIPNTCKFIDDQVFQGCSNLVNVVLPPSVKSVGKRCFSSCYSLESITLSASIGDECFYYSRALKHVRILEGAKSIGSWCFRDYDNYNNGTVPLEDMEIPGTIESFGSYPFGTQRTRRTQVKITVDPENIYESVIYNGKLLGTSYALDYANFKIFNKNTDEEITTLVIPNTDRWQPGSTDGYAYFGQNQYYLGHWSNILNFALEPGGHSSISVVDGIAYDKTGKALLFYPGGRGGKVVIPEGVEFISYGSLTYHPYITELVMPSTLRKMPNQQGLEGLPALEKLDFSAVTNYINLGSYLMGYNSSMSTKLTTVIFPNNGSVGGQSFNGCPITDMTVPENFNLNSNISDTGAPTTIRYVLSSINNFKGSKQMSENTTVHLIDKATGEEMTNIDLSSYSGEMPSFGCCKNIESVVLGNKISRLNRPGFCRCDKITEITIPNSVTYIGESVFSFTSIKSLWIPDGVTINCEEGYSNSSPFTNMPLLESIRFPDTMETMPDRLIWNCPKLTTFNWPASLKTMKATFSGCTSITSLTIPSRVTSVGMFRGMTALESLTFEEPCSVTSFSSMGYLFYCPDADYESNRFPALKEITIPFVGLEKNATEASANTLFASMFFAGTYRHSYCNTEQKFSENSSSYYAFIPENLEKVTVLGGKIFYGAFMNCTNLKTIILKNISPADIDAHAFDGCSQDLQVIYE